MTKHDVDVTSRTQTLARGLTSMQQAIRHARVSQCPSVTLMLPASIWRR